MHILIHMYCLVLRSNILFIPYFEKFYAVYDTLSTIVVQKDFYPKI